MDIYLFTESKMVLIKRELEKQILTLYFPLLSFYHLGNEKSASINNTLIGAPLFELG